jgi:hypothetical protein
VTRGTLTDLAGWSLIFLAGFWAGEWWAGRKH